MRGSQEAFEEISPADFFYRNRDIAGFQNPSRAIYSTVRELVENSLDACESIGVPPDIRIQISEENVQTPEGVGTYRIRVEDNGAGVPREHIPQAFGQILYGSKYRLKQLRGTFGLGGKMSILYAEITTNKPAKIVSSTGGSKIHDYELMIDIQANKPKIIRHRALSNSKRWRGTIVELMTQGDYARAQSKILEYLKQTAIVVPYADITCTDPEGVVHRFERATSTMPKLPTEALPHPQGMNVEGLKRIIAVTKTTTLIDFMTAHFQRVGETTAKRFLAYANMNSRKNPKKLSADEVVQLANAMATFDGFISPDASCLSPLGEKLLEAGIRKQLEPEFVAVVQRKPSSYSGFPFIVEVGLAYGGKIPPTGGVSLYRFANKIPLLFDEASDVSRKVINELVNWRQYKVTPETPAAAFVHIASLKIPYKTVGKEFIADRPEVEREILFGLREAGRRLSVYLSRRIHMEHEKRRLEVFEKYLPQIAAFATKLAKKKTEPDIKPLLKDVAKHGYEDAED